MFNVRFLIDESRNDSPVAEPKAVHQNNGNRVDAQRGFSPIFRNKSPTPVIQETLTDVNNEVSDSDYEGEESMRYLTEEEMAADRAAARRGQKANGGFFGSAVSLSFLFRFQFIFQIAFAVVFVLLAVFTYFLLENAEQFKFLTEPKSDDVI